MSDIIVTSNMSNGIISRYAKQSFIQNSSISPVLFDLRDRKPPEEFVSFYKVNDKSEDKRFNTAIKSLSLTPKQNGVIVLLNIEEVLEEVNDEDENIISFKEQNLPHCGLFYLIDNLTKIQEAKTTLSYLASQRFRFIKDIEYKQKGLEQ